MADSTTYTNIDISMMKKLVFVRGVSVIERAMISSVVNEIAELVDASSGTLNMTLERVRQLADGSFLGVLPDSPDTRSITKDFRGKECVRIYICEEGSTVQTFNLIISYQGLISLIGNFNGFLKFTLKKFQSDDTSGDGSSGGSSTDTVCCEESLGKNDSVLNNRAFIYTDADAEMEAAAKAKANEKKSSKS